MGKLADYVISVLTELLGEAPDRERTFPWAFGDPSPKTGRRRLLAFDAFWPSRRLLVEVDEPQHRRPTGFWDKEHRPTVSGVHRGEQRRRYDERKRGAAQDEGYRLLVIEVERRPKPHRRDRKADREGFRRQLGEALGEAPEAQERRPPRCER